MHALNRRKFIHGSALSVGGAAFANTLLSGRSQAQEGSGEDPHFFLEVLFPNGMDPLYSFDSRPLAMTAAGIVANYLKADPDLLSDSQGRQALVTPMTKGILAHFDRFSILNGVIMSRDFDGHDNNLNYLLTGNPFGGESYLPHLNQIGTPTPIDFVATGEVFANVTNAANMVPLTPESAKGLAARLSHVDGLRRGDSLQQFAADRARIAAQGSGRNAAGARAISAALRQLPNVAAGLSSLGASGGGQASPNPDGADPVLAEAVMVGKLFKAGLCRSVQMVMQNPLIPNLQLDTHAGSEAARSPQMFQQCMDALATVFKHLRETPFDDRNSLLDVTTVLVGSEFGRTLRSEFMAPGSTLADSGTDHNPLRNTILLGGKGIRCGIIAGASDVAGVREEVSAAHKSLDAKVVKAMGRPIDFATLAPKAELPASYKPEEYLDFACIANTVYRLFGAPATRLRPLVRSGPPAPFLSSLLA